MDFLNVEGRMTAGRLAELTGLTTGAITGVVDRMEKAGLVRRERDSEDRRKVFIVPVPERVVEIGRFADQGYKAVLSATEELKTMMMAPKEKRKSATKPARKP
jgi:DNA-binding MarR family transcriptional regulator